MKGLFTTLCLLALALGAKSATTNFYKTTDGVNAYWSAVATPPPPPPDDATSWLLHGNWIVPEESTNSVRIYLPTSALQLGSNFNVVFPGLSLQPGIKYLVSPPNGDSNSFQLFLAVRHDNDNRGGINVNLDTNEHNALWDVDTSSGRNSLEWTLTRSNVHLHMTKFSADLWSFKPGRDAAEANRAPYQFGVYDNTIDALNTNLVEFYHGLGIVSGAWKSSIGTDGAFVQRTSSRVVHAGVTNNMPATNGLPFQRLINSGTVGTSGTLEWADLPGPDQVLVNAVKTNIFIGNIGPGITDIYTPPAGFFCAVRHLYLSSTNDIGSSTANIAVKTNGVYYRLGPNATISTITPVDFGTSFIFQPNETLAVTNQLQGINIAADLLLYPTTAKLFSKKLYTPAASTNILYTVPNVSGKEVVWSTQAPSVVGIAAELVISYMNASGANRTVTFFAVPNGGAVSSTNQLGTVSAANLALTSRLYPTLKAGDSLAVALDAATADQLIWTTVFEGNNR